jgi:hypothetical protein
MKMDKPCIYENCVEGQLTDLWSDWFNDLMIHYDTDSKTTLSRPLADQGALFGMRAKIHVLNLTLISVSRLSSRE